MPKHFVSIMFIPRGGEQLLLSHCGEMRDSCFIPESAKCSPRVQLFANPGAWFGQRRESYTALSAEEIDRFRAL